MITMYDTKTRELRWNATYNEYSAPPYDEKLDYSRTHPHTRAYTHSQTHTHTLHPSPLPLTPALFLPSPVPEMAHLVSSGDGLLVTVDRESGDVLWSHDYGSPVMGVYLYASDTLRHAPHLSIATETLRYLTFSSASDTHSIKWSYQFVKEQLSAHTQLVYVDTHTQPCTRTRVCVF